MLFHILTGEIDSLENFKDKLNSLISTLFILTLFLTLFLMDNGRYLNSKIIYIGTYPFRMYKKYKLAKYIILVLTIVLAIESVYINIYIKYFHSDDKVQTIKINKKDCCFKKVYLEGTPYYCIKVKDANSSKNFDIE